jgi:hypothetical protein
MINQFILAPIHRDLQFINLYNISKQINYLKK